jgi:hypothetical protein
VERIINGTAEVIYATGPTSSEARSSPGKWVRLKGKIERGTLNVPIDPDITVKYSVSDDNEISGTYVIASRTMRSKLKRADIAPIRTSDLVPLPEDVEILMQEKNQGGDLQSALFSGAWSGWWGGSLPHILIVASVKENKADVIYAVGSHIPPRHGWRPGWVRVEGIISDNTLTFKLRSKIQVSYRSTENGELEGMYVIDGNTSRALLRRTQIK